MNTTKAINWRHEEKYPDDYNIRDKKLPKKASEEKQELFIKMCLK